MTKRGYTVEHAEMFHDGRVTFTAYGDIEWDTVDGTVYGRTMASLPDPPHDGYPDFEYRAALNPHVIARPRFLVFLGGFVLARVDINGPHQRDAFTHLQRIYKCGSNKGTTEDLRGRFVEVPDEDTITDDLLNRCYREAARRLRIDVSAVRWTAPDIETVMT